MDNASALAPVDREKVSTRVSLALLGVRSDAPVRRTGGAGPSDDGHFVVDGDGAAIPSIRTVRT